jgi:hypothetical protein
MKNFAITLLAGLGLLAAGCAKDNITPPTSQLTGRVTYQNQPLNVRGSGNVQLELWQRGEYFRNKIQVYVAQDGTYSADLFDGDYKLTRLRDNGPWQNNTDSISVTVKGNTVVDVPVTPYFTIGTATIAKSGSNVTNQFVAATKFSADLTNLSQPVSLSVGIPSTAKGTIYARVGVKTQGVNELIYSPVQTIAL